MCIICKFYLHTELDCRYKCSIYILPCIYISVTANEKSDAMRRPSTGGDPKPPSPTPVE